MTTAVIPLLTERQRRILDFIRDHQTLHGYACTLREIADGCGLASVSSVGHQLRRLQDAGWIRRHPHRPRSLVVLNPADGTDT